MGHILTITKVDGIEMFATVRGHALVCDACNESYDGGNGADKGGPYMPQGYRSCSTDEIVADALALGWKGLEKYLDPTKVRGVPQPDLCPVCAAMRGAPQHVVAIHEPLGHLELAYQPKGPLLQRHSVVLPLTRTFIQLTATGWSPKNRFNEPPAVMLVKIVPQAPSPSKIVFDPAIIWPGRTKTQTLPPDPLLRLWSWGDRVYAKDVSTTS